MADVVVVGDRDRGPVADDVAELEAELDPAGGVLGMAVGLVAGEEQQVGVLALEVLDDLGPHARVRLELHDMFATTITSLSIGSRRISPSNIARSPCRTR